MKLKTKTALVLLLTASLVIQVFTAIPAIAAENDPVYKAYYDLIKELHNKEDASEVFDRFKLIYVDNDDIPELLAVNTPSDEFDNNGIYFYELYTYYDGKAVKLGSYSSGVASAGGYRGDTKYIKKSGKIFETFFSSGSGDGSDIVYEMKDGKMTEIAHGDFNIESENSVWKGKTISAAKYNKKLKKVFNTKKGKSFEDLKTVSYSKMRKKLK